MNSTIYDDVFRTIVYKMPYLVVPLINEAFGTDYPGDVKIERLQNESFDTEAGNERITDTYLKIGGHVYHIECQSSEDGGMVLRMIEYDFRIALERAQEEDDFFTLRFPKSFVLYLRGNRAKTGHSSKQNDKKELKAKVIFPNGAEFMYSVPRINASDYDTDDIFTKRLLMLLPFYIMRCEKEFGKIEQDEKELKKLLNEYQKIAEKLYNVLEGAERSGVYSDLIHYINMIADHLLISHEHIRKEVGRVMGGKILELESERLIRIGKEQGIEQGIERGSL